MIGIVARRLSICLLSIIISTDIVKADKSGELIKYLLANNNPSVRPVNSSQVTVQVNFSVEIVQILAVDDRNQFIKLATWVRQSWMNYLTNWDPKDWDNITQIKLPGSVIWSPNLVLYNSHDGGYVGGTSHYQTDIVITYTGQSYWFSPVTFTAFCESQSRNFPYDEKTCVLIFGSWTDDDRLINVSTANIPVTTDSYRESSEWSLLTSYTKTESKIYKCCKYPFTRVNFFINIKRKPTFQVFNIVLPCLILVVNVFFPFYLPPDYGERVTLAMTILLAVAVFLQAVSETLPTSSDHTPILGLLYLVIMAETVLSVIFCCISLILYYRGRSKNPKEIPQWMRYVFIYVIAQLFKINRANSNDNRICYDHHQDQINLSELNDERARKKSSVAFLYGNKKQCSSEIQLLTYRIVRNIRGLMLKQDTTTEEENKQDDWKYVAKIIDRIFFYFLVILVTVTITSILLPPFLEHENL